MSGAKGQRAAQISQSHFAAGVGDIHTCSVSGENIQGFWGLHSDSVELRLAAVRHWLNAKSTHSETKCEILCSTVLQSFIASCVQSSFNIIPRHLQVFQNLVDTATWCLVSSHFVCFLSSCLCSLLSTARQHIAGVSRPHCYSMLLYLVLDTDQCFPVHIFDVWSLLLFIDLCLYEAKSLWRDKR